tara:strand:- start:1150 stop:1653 length:504 start_codon:yes stop_codon:yes gene_type:complete
MKKIIIKGKRNIEGLDDTIEKKRQISKKWNNKEILNEKNHNSYVNMLYLNEKFEGSNIILSELKNKINSYKNQDKKKKILKEVINIEELLEKLVISKLSCYYCKMKCLLMYDNIREMRQWTLDRLDNDIGHNKDNIVICCLKCNLKRRTMNDEDFKFIKQMKIIKKN